MSCLMSTFCLVKAGELVSGKARFPRVHAFKNKDMRKTPTFFDAVPELVWSFGFELTFLPESGPVAKTSYFTR